MNGVTRREGWVLLAKKDVGPVVPVPFHHGIMVVTPPQPSALFASIEGMVSWASAEEPVESGRLGRRD